MRRLLLGLVACLVLASMASAEVMLTACPLGKGKWGFMTGGMVDWNYYNMGGSDVMYMDSIGYGLNNKLDLYITGGIGYSEKTSMMNIMSMTFYGANLKYTLLSENLSTPISVAAVAGIREMPMSMKTMIQTQTSLGLIASKMIDLYTPYAGLTYRSTNQVYYKYPNFTQWDLTLGLGIGPMEKMLMIEDTLQSIQFTGGPSFSSNQISIGACFALN